MDSNANNLPSGRPVIAAAAALGALLASSGVVMGALGAHAWKETLETAGTLASWQTAVLYHLVHAVAAFATALSGQKAFGVVAWLWIAGVVLFSGSLYALSLGGPKWLGPVTPAGGLVLILGWLLAAIVSCWPAPTSRGPAERKPQ